MEHELKITRQLMESCGAGDVAQIKSTLAQCNDAPSRIQKARDANGKTLLHFAAATGQIPVVKYLMGVMAQDQSKLHQVVNAVDNDGSTPLTNACGAAPDDTVVETVTQLLSFGADPTIVGSNGVGPLHRAAGEGHVDVITLLVEHHAHKSNKSTKSTDNTVATPNDPNSALALALNANASETGTALHWACSEKKLLALQCLIDHGADLNVANQAGLPPVMVAAAGGSGQAVAALVNAGCRTSATLPGGVTLLHMCCEIPDEEESFLAVTSLLSTRSPPVLQALGAKYEPSAAHPRGLLPVELAAREGNAKVVELLLDSVGEDKHQGTSTTTRSVAELIAFEQAAQQQERENVKAARKKGQVVDDGTPMRVLLPRVTQAATSPEEVASSEQCKERGNGFFRSGELQKAVGAYSEGIALNGGNHVLWGNRCACHLKLKHWDQAVFDASAALHIDAGWHKARVCCCVGGGWWLVLVGEGKLLMLFVCSVLLINFLCKFRCVWGKHSWGWKGTKMPRWRCGKW